MPSLRPQLNLAKLIRDVDLRRVVKRLSRLDDVQIAGEVDNLSEDDQDKVFQALPLERRSAVFARLRYETAGRLVLHYTEEDAAKLFRHLETDDIADILGRIKREHAIKILACLPSEEAADVEDLLAYEDDSAGGIMSTDFVEVSEEASCSDALGVIQGLDDPPEQAFFVYVVDRERRLQGVVSLRALVVGKPNQSIRDVMMSDFVSVTPDTDQEEVADLASRYDLISVPVVDEQRHMIGVVTIDDIVDVLREEATEDILKMAGAGEMLIDTRSYWASFRARVPWLFYSATGGLLVATALSGFQDTLHQIPILALFMPVVAGMAGNVGMQSSTIVVRGLAVGYVETANLSRLLLRESLLGGGLGLIFGFLIAFLGPLAVGNGSNDPWALATVLSLGMVGSMTIAATVGAGVPLVMDRYGVDPAIATGPFVTTSVDALGLVFYFWLAAMLLEVPF